MNVLAIMTEQLLRLVLLKPGIELTVIEMETDKPICTSPPVLA